MIINIIKKPIKITKSYKRIEKIYKEISEGLEDGSITMEAFREKMDETGLLINELENSLPISSAKNSIYQ